MQIGCHASVFTGTLDRDGIDRAVDGVADAGFDLIELPLMESVDIDYLHGALDRRGLAVTASLGLSADIDISSEDQDTVTAGEKRLGEVLDQVIAVGGTHLTGVIYSAMQKYMLPATERGRANSAGVLSRLTSRALDEGVTVGIEVVNRYETNIVNTGHAALAFLDEIAQYAGAAPLLHLDTYHMNIEEPDMASAVLEAEDRLGYVHIGESHRGYLGSGTVDFDTFFKALVRVDYDGPIVFESFSSAIVHPQLSRMLGVWRDLWDDPLHLASDARVAIGHYLTAAGSIAAH